MKTKILIVCALVSLLGVGCSSEHSLVEGNDGQVRFSSGVVSGQTRVGGDNGDQWESGDAIGVYMVDRGTTDIVGEAGNIRYATTSSGKLATFTSDAPIYYPVDAAHKVDFITYHPYKAAVTDYIYPVDVTNQSSLSDIDLLRAAATNDGVGYDKNYGGYVSLKLDHKLAKLRFRTIAADGLSDEDLKKMTVTVRGMATKAVYHIDTDILEAPTDVADILANIHTAGVLYEAIIVPQALVAHQVKVKFALNNELDEVFEYSIPSPVFGQGEIHSYDVQITRTEIRVSASINPWESMGTTQGTAL